MANNSSLQGTVWYWRQGIRQSPMHSHRDFGDIRKTRELYMPVKGETHAQTIINELKQNGVELNMKKTHSSYDVVPAGSLIVFAPVSLVLEQPSERENIEKLKNYISEHGGRIVENVPKKSILKGIVSALFGGGRR